MMGKQIFEAIQAVQSEISAQGISKDRKNTQQGYSFRGIDDVLNALSPLFAKHKIFAIPRITPHSSERLETKSGGTIEHVKVDAEFEFFSVEDGSSLIAKVPGQAMDSADKATNKAMSAAFKYACFLVFCIPLEGTEDADQVTHEVVPSEPKPDINQEEINRSIEAESKNLLDKATKKVLVATNAELDAIKKQAQKYLDEGRLTQKHFDTLINEVIEHYIG